MTESAKGLLFSRDLMFISRMTGTASQLGKQVDVVGQWEDLLQRAAEGSFGCLFLDLSISGLDLPEIVSRMRDLGIKTVAFGAHVQTEQLAAAEAAGCDEVHPRSRFSAQLPQILARCLR